MAKRKTAAAGAKYTFGWFVDSDGFITGASPTVPTKGATGSGAFLMEGIKEAAPTTPEQEVVQDTGDDTLIAEFNFDSIATRSFVAQFAIQDATIETAVTGVSIVTQGTSQVWVTDIDNAPEYNFGFLFQGRAINQDSGTDGQKEWTGKFVPVASAKPLGRAAFSERAPAIFNWSIIPQVAGYDAYGITINDTNYGTVGGRYINYADDYPLHVMAFKGTGAVSTFNLDYTPVSAAGVYAVVERTAVAVLSVSTTNKTVTLAASPADNARVTIGYKFSS